MIDTLKAWSEGAITLAAAAEGLGIEPETVIERAKDAGLKVPSRADVELFRIRNANYRASHDDDPA